MSNQMKHRVLLLHDYHVWANIKYFEQLRTLPEDVCHTEIQSVFPTIRKVLVHIGLTDVVWLGVMRGDSYDDIIAAREHYTHKFEGQQLDGIGAIFEEISVSYQDFFAEQDDLDQFVKCEHPKFGRLDAPLAELVQHVCNHGTYHRGNLSAMLHQLGYKGASTDYIFYLYEMNQ
jgi:uncharacterized damage-inducible protein DinB